MNDKELADDIKKHEGFRDTVYLDTVGVATVGYGHALHEGSRIPHLVADLLFEQDFNDAKKDYEILANREGLCLTPLRKGVLINMLFNMGLRRVMGFKKMLAALQADNWGEAATQMLDSKWAHQVGPRAKDLAEKMRRG